MGRVTVDHFRQVADAALREQPVHAAEVSARRRDCRRIEIPSLGQRFAEYREGPRPRGAIMICGFTPSVLIALVASRVRLGGIVQQSSIVAEDRQRRIDRERRE